MDVVTFMNQFSYSYVLLDEHELRETCTEADEAGHVRAKSRFQGFSTR